MASERFSLPRIGAIGGSLALALALGGVAVTAATHAQTRRSPALEITACYQGSRALSVVNGRDQCPIGTELYFPSWRAFTALRLRPGPA